MYQICNLIKPPLNYFRDPYYHIIIGHSISPFAHFYNFLFAALSEHQALAFRLIFVKWT
jgi:hypothetical protein